MLPLPRENKAVLRGILLVKQWGLQGIWKENIGTSHIKKGTPYSREFIRKGLGLFRGSYPFFKGEMF